jgi:hypothetical protein
MLKCTDCKQLKSEDNFHSDRTSATGKQSRCKPCAIKRVLEWKRKNPRKVKDNYVKSVYGIRLHIYEDWLKQQNYQCAICGHPHSDAEQLSVDHSHITGTVRGLLCKSCNWGLGNFEDDPVRLLKAVEYLQRLGQKS